MKKFLPFVFPLVALLIVLFLGYRWYNSKTNRPEGKISEFAEGVKIEDLSDAKVNQLNTKKGIADTNRVELKGTDQAKGEVRYEIKDGKVSFTVLADLEELKEGRYQVWLKQVDGEAKKKAFALEYTKGGYIGSAAISADTLPFTVLISKEKNDDDQIELPVLSGTLTKEVKNTK